MSDLTTKQQLFIDAYLECWNATEAARQAGYKGNDITLASVGWENLRKPAIAAAIDHRISELSKDSDSRIRSAASLMSENRTIRKKRKSRFVYFLREEFGLTKVGIAVDIESRINQIQTSYPYRLDLLALIDSDHARSIELKIHTQYEHKRHRGEWFELSYSEINDVLKEYGGEWSEG